MNWSILVEVAYSQFTTVLSYVNFVRLLEIEIKCLLMFHFNDFAS